MIFSPEAQNKFFDELEKDGLTNVKIQIANHKYGQKTKMAETWVRIKDSKNESIYNKEILKLYGEANELAKQANNISQKANNKSITANFIAGISVLISLVLLYLNKF